MIYKGQFRDINNNLYTIQITTEGDTTTKEITLGGSPFTTEMDSDGKTLYKSAKYQSATVEIITPDYNFDIFSAKAQGTKVELLKEDGTLVWTGYVEPNIYSMGFKEYREKIQLECIDALSSLQYIKYKSTTKTVLSFLEIIRKLLQACNSYKYFYISNSTQLAINGTASILDKLYISEQNFFDDKKDDETDDDVAWTDQDILEEICQYLGVTAVADGDSVYFLDYDAIKNGYNDYYKYSVSGTDAGTLTTVSFSKTITAIDYSESDSKLSLDTVYNKVTIKADLHTFDDVIPDVFDDSTNITSSADVITSAGQAISIVIKDNRWTINSANVSTTINSDEGYMEIFLDESSKGIKSLIVCKYFKSPYIKCYNYDSNTYTSDVNYTNVKNNLKGAILAKMYVKEVDDDTWNETKSAIAKGEDAVDSLMAALDITNISNLTKYIVMDNPSTSHIVNADATSYPFIETTFTDNSSLFGGDNSYLVIEGKFQFNDNTHTPYPVPQGEDDGADKKRTLTKDDGGYLLAKLQWGTKYWNGTTWTTTDSTFHIPFISKEIRQKEARDKDQSFANNGTWRIGSSEKGYFISLKDQALLSGIPKLTIYKPIDPTNNDDLFHNIFIKEFTIKAIIGDPTYSDKNDDDTVYTNIIDNTSVKELSTIKFKICTWDNKKPNYNSVAYKNNSELYFLNKTFNNALQSGETSINGFDGIAASSGLRQEEHYIYRIYNQYNSTSIILSLNLRNDNKIYGLYKDTAIGTDKSFIIDKMNIDYKMNETEITLIEKK